MTVDEMGIIVISSLKRGVTEAKPSEPFRTAMMGLRTL